MGQVLDSRQGYGHPGGDPFTDGLLVDMETTMGSLDVEDTPGASVRPAIDGSSSVP